MKIWNSYLIPVVLTNRVPIRIPPNTRIPREYPEPDPTMIPGSGRETRSSVRVNCIFNRRDDCGTRVIAVIPVTRIIRTRLFGVCLLAFNIDNTSAFISLCSYSHWTRITPENRMVHIFNSINRNEADKFTVRILIKTRTNPINRVIRIDQYNFDYLA